MIKQTIALVLGGGIKEDGTIPESAKSRVEKAVELLKAGEVNKILFSGKYSYSLQYTPPSTEAKAMSRYAKSLGAQDEDMVLEENSVTTVSNFCESKKVLQKNGWKKVMLITMKPFEKRNMVNMKKVLGPLYDCQFVLSNFRYPVEKEQELEELEKGKVQDAISFFKDIGDGDDEAIYRLAMEDLEKNYKK